MTPRCIPVTRLLLAGALLLGSGAAMATVFGDGDPANGFEDDRRTLSQGARHPDAHGWFDQAGTIVCDGAVRGSAVVLDLSRQTAVVHGVVLVTAAHVLYDLESGERWNQCAYHHLGLGELPGYRAPLSWRWMIDGNFDPLADPSEVAQGQGDWAFLWLGRAWNLPRGGPGLQPGLGDPAAMEPGSLGLVAWDSQRAEMSVMTGCHAQLSTRDDLGGGAWDGQWLDDCDSGSGASGGGLIALGEQGSVLVGVRSGSHWDLEHAHAPPGEPWDVTRSTNYARAFDAEILAALQQFLASLDRLDEEAGPIAAP